jgi:flagellar basal-body rod protein FlgG
MRALFTAATGMSAQQTRLDTISNNLANVNTTGYKKSRAEFQDLFYETLRAPGALAANGTALPSGVQIGNGVKLAAVGKQMGQGEFVSTGRDLDVAIEGEGFFQVERPDGETLYSRDGTFSRDRDGNVVTSEGFLLVPSIQIPLDAIQITILRDGTVSILQAGQSAPVDAGQIELARFANPAGLRAVGGNAFVPTEASGDAQTGAPDDQGFGSLAQGFLENANVNVAEELVNMILTQRAFELNARAIQAGDEMLQTIGALSR